MKSRADESLDEDDFLLDLDEDVIETILAREPTENEVMMAIRKIARGTGDYRDEAIIFEYLLTYGISEENEATFYEDVSIARGFFINEGLKGYLFH